MLFVIVVKIRVSCAPSPSFPLGFGILPFHVQAMSALLLCPLGLAGDGRPEWGRGPVGRTGLQAREGPVWGWRWGWYRARLGVPAPGASMIGKEIPPRPPPPSVLWEAPPC